MVLWCDQCDDGVNRMEFPSEKFRMQRIIVPRIALHITTVTTTVTTKVITFITTMMVVPSPLSSLPSSPLSGDLESYKKLSSSSTEDSFIGFLRRNFYNVKKSFPFLFFTRFLFRSETYICIPQWLMFVQKSLSHAPPPQCIPMDLLEEFAAKMRSWSDDDDQRCLCALRGGKEQFLECVYNPTFITSSWYPCQTFGGLSSWNVVCCPVRHPERFGP